jgi:hypothetical protein
VDSLFVNWIRYKVTPLIVLLTASITDSASTTKYMITAFYVFARLLIGTLNILLAIIFPHFRLFHVWNAVIAIIPTSLWIGALWIPYPVSLMLQWLSFGWGNALYFVTDLDWFPYYILFLIFSAYGYITNNAKYRGTPLMDLMEYYPAVDMDLRIERTGNFITIVLGYIVVNLIYQSSAAIGFNA